MNTSKTTDIVIKPLPFEDIPLAAESEILYLESEGWSAQAIVDTLKLNGHYFAAYINGKFAGHAGLTAVSGEGYINNVVTVAHFRKMGVGTQLIKALIQFAHENKLEFLTLEVRESNTTAIHLYEKHNFKECGKRKRFYSNPTEDAIIMTLYF